ncbi:MAG TPA: NnrS family protein, partial [Casimicrobiaceae bacterium]|nr:NnrS family protein [Casimicrobiaceae bacterium]
GLRAWLWRPWQTLRVPLVWVLHAGYLWIPLYLALRALAEAGALPMPIATHALTVGAIGMLTIGMMSRTARGHSGRPLAADHREVAAYALVGAAALTRVVVPLVATSLYRDAVIASASMWSAAYAIYAVHYWPILTRPRIDGKPG